MMFKSKKTWVKKERGFKNYLFEITVRSFRQSLMLLLSQFSFYF